MEPKAIALKAAWTEQSNEKGLISMGFGRIESQGQIHQRKQRMCRGLKLSMCGLPWWILSAALVLAAVVMCAPENDLVTSLPGQPGEVSFKQYAGYVTVDEFSGRALFYYFAEAQTNPELRPLVIWFNGGPGCSSFGVGAMTENGPFQPKAGTLIRNNNSWNTEANMLYVETPAGVGFSYSNDSSYYQGVDDNKTAHDNLQFLHGWFEKFPEYKTRDLYLTGESYAGHYIPQLAELIVETNSKSRTFNLKGISLGNPVLDFYTDFNARGPYLWTHGLISDPTYELVSTVCMYSQYVDQYYRGSISSICSQVFAMVRNEISKFVDRYDVTQDVCLKSIDMQSLKLRAEVMAEKDIAQLDVCIQDEATAYLNMEAVQKALHARLLHPVKKWQPCSQKVVVYNNLNLEIPTIPIVGRLLLSGIRVLVYSGDQDSVIPLTGTRTLINNLAISMQLPTTISYRVWFQGNQVAGWNQVYGDMLTYATVRGASHEAPYSQPERSLLLFQSFLKGKPLPANISQH